MNASAKNANPAVARYAMYSVFRKSGNSSDRPPVSNGRETFSLNSQSSVPVNLNVAIG